MTVGFFMPLPLAVMIPFMAGQSFAMGEAFGKGFQYGKRRISAMTNEQFNSMSAKDHFEETTADISEMIPSMKSQMNNFSTLQTDIIKTLIEQLKNAGITIGEAVASGAGEVFAEGPSGGTQLAQSSLDNLRSIVGLPPIYSKLVAPAGIGALISFWRNSNLLSSLKASLNPNQWIWERLKQIFNTTPPTNTITEIVNILINSNFIGPPVPSGGITPPSTQPGNTITVGDDGTITNVDTRTPIGTAGTIRAPSSIITQFNKYNAESQAIKRHISQFGSGSGFQGSEAEKTFKTRIQLLNKLMFDLWIKYDLVGKVNSSSYNGPNQLVS